VNSHIDTAKFNSFPGKYRLLVIMTVQADGRIRDIIVKTRAPDSIANEYRRAIEQSPLWKPALMDDMPVEAEVALRFVLTVE
jgi:hypothetical protein